MKPDLHDFLLNAPTLRSNLKTITLISFCSEELSLYRTRSGAPVERFVQEEIFLFFFKPRLYERAAEPEVIFRRHVYCFRMGVSGCWGRAAWHRVSHEPSFGAAGNVYVEGAESGWVVEEGFKHSIAILLFIDHLMVSFTKTRNETLPCK